MPKSQYYRLPCSDGGRHRWHRKGNGKDDWCLQCGKYMREVIKRKEQKPCQRKR